MRGLWKPFVLYGAVALGFSLILQLKDGFLPLERAIPLWAGMLVSGFVFGGLFTLQASTACGRFLKGMREAGADVDVLEDDFGWWGARRVRARTAQGEWRLEAQGGRGVRLNVKAPGVPKSFDVSGNARKAGARWYEEAAGLRVPDVVPPGVRAIHVTREKGRRAGADRVRPGLAAIILVSAAGLTLAGAWGLAGPTSAIERTTYTILYWLGLGVAGFIALVMGFSLPWFRYKARVDALGRRGGAALMLSGLGLALVVLGALGAGAAALARATVTVPFLVAAAGAGATAAGVGVLADARVPPPSHAHGRQPPRRRHGAGRPEPHHRVHARGACRAHPLPGVEPGAPHARVMRRASRGLRKDTNCARRRYPRVANL